MNSMYEDSDLRQNVKWHLDLLLRSAGSLCLMKYCYMKTVECLLCSHNSHFVFWTIS